MWLLKFLLCRLYNKDAVIEFLLDKSADKTPMEAASHIKSIKVRRFNTKECHKIQSPVRPLLASHLTTNKNC